MLNETREIWTLHLLSNYRRPDQRGARSTLSLFFTFNAIQLKDSEHNQLFTSDDTPSTGFFTSVLEFAVGGLHFWAVFNFGWVSSELITSLTS